MQVLDMAEFLYVDVGRQSKIGGNKSELDYKTCGVISALDASQFAV